MKPYGLRPGDGLKYINKFTRVLDEGGPRGKNKEAKMHKQRCLVHRQGRQDGKKEILKAESDL